MSNELRTATSRIILALYRDGHPDKAMLAGLRNAPTITSQRAQTVWPLIMGNLDERQLSHSEDGTPSPEEVAVYTAIRFYAIYQQGNDGAQVYASAWDKGAKGVTLFGALGNLRGNEDLRIATDRRVQPLLATTNVAGVINGLTHLVSILKANSGVQKIDFAALAQDLYWLQGSYEQASRIRLRWGQQYFSVKQADTQTEGEKN